MNRDFSDERPNQKWVTDISYIHTQEGVLYLSIIRDLFDKHDTKCTVGFGDDKGC